LEADTDILGLLVLVQKRLAGIDVTKADSVCDDSRLCIYDRNLSYEIL
jgi:hypothetical protein